ncbi:hypothetical protein J4E93_006658 [Alternaria ventricosa]|uniref:uncharacterized protein n=1 Tax=Alternaria ventricosa TaxID=1187951 RepID=UPI0020C2E508|nr:uncharacterized protein J4E93_006658 [Alternaria ventricosa]KAI4643646.1 hypothetical protein J4E93_006658 [Alternaria ventricosa]
MVNNEALERSGDGINEKLTGFNALATKDKMKRFLVELNATIPRFKDQGTADWEQTRAKEPVSRSAELFVTNTPTTPSAKRPAAASQLAASQPAASKRVKRAAQAADGGDSSEQAGDDPQATMPSMLSRLFVTDAVQLSTPILACLNALGSPLSAVAVQKQDSDDLTTSLSPLVEPISMLIAARDSIIPTHSYLDNFGRLAVALRKHPVTAPACLGPFLAGLNFTLVESQENAEESGDTSTSHQEAAVLAELDVLSNEVNRAFEVWRAKFPPPPSDSLLYPVDFDKDERIALRAFGRKYITKNPKLEKKGAARAVLLAAYKEILASWPVERGGSLASAKSVLVEARKNVGLLKGKPLSSNTPDYEMGDEEEDHGEAPCAEYE